MLLIFFDPHWVLVLEFLALPPHFLGFPVWFLVDLHGLQSCNQIFVSFFEAVSFNNLKIMSPMHIHKIYFSIGIIGMFNLCYIKSGFKKSDTY